MRLAARGSAAQETSTCMSERGETLNVEGARSGLFGEVASRTVFTPNGRRVMVTSLPFLTGNRMGRSFSRRSVSVAAATLPMKGSATLAVVAAPWVSLKRAMSPPPLASAGLMVLHTIFGLSMRTKLEDGGRAPFFLPFTTVEISGFNTSQPNWSALPACQPPSWLRIDQLNRTGPCWSQRMFTSNMLSIRPRYIRLLAGYADLHADRL